MHTFQLSKCEVLYQQKQFYEDMQYHGVPCKIYPISDVHEDAYDFYNDIVDVSDSSYESCINTYMTFEELPTTKTLKSLGWYVDDSAMPAIGYIPVIYKNNHCELTTFRPKVDDKVILRADPLSKAASDREFLLKDFIGNGFPSTIYYTVKLVPCRKDDTGESGVSP